MKILLTNNNSILEYLYRLSSEEEVELTMSVAEADIIVGTSFKSNFYDKILVIPSIKSSNTEDIIRLSKVNKIISRLPLGDIGVEYAMEPYELKKLNSFNVTSIRNKPISELSIKDFIITTYKKEFFMEGATSYLGTKYKGNPTLVGLLKHQLEEN